MWNLKSEYINNFKNIKKYYDYLSIYSVKNTHVGLINEWILDNFYLLIKREKWITDTLNSNEFYKTYYKNNSIYKLINRILVNDNYKISYSNLFDSINNYQNETNTVFSYRELQYVPELIYLSLIRKLSEMTSFEFNAVKSIKNAKRFIYEIKNDFDMGKYFENKIGLLHNYTFIENTYNNLSELGNNYDSYLKEFTSILKDNDIDLHKTLEKSYSTEADHTIIISNLFGSIVKLDSIDRFNVYTRVSKTEELLLKDEYYLMSDMDTKNSYREKIIYISAKQKMSEYEYVKDFYSKNL